MASYAYMSSNQRIGYMSHSLEQGFAYYLQVSYKFTRKCYAPVLLHIQKEMWYTLLASINMALSFHWAMMIDSRMMSSLHKH